MLVRQNSWCWCKFFEFLLSYVETDSLLLIQSLFMVFTLKSHFWQSIISYLLSLLAEADGGQLRCWQSRWGGAIPRAPAKIMSGSRRARLPDEGGSDDRLRHLAFPLPHRCVHIYFNRHCSVPNTVWRQRHSVECVLAVVCVCGQVAAPRRPGGARALTDQRTWRRGSGIQSARVLQLQSL